jgi:hypothetical protein
MISRLPRIRKISVAAALIYFIVSIWISHSSSAAQS